MFFRIASDIIPSAASSRQDCLDTCHLLGATAPIRCCVQQEMCYSHTIRSNGSRAEYPFSSSNRVASVTILQWWQKPSIDPYEARMIAEYPADEIAEKPHSYLPDRILRSYLLFEDFPSAERTISFVVRSHATSYSVSMKAWCSSRPTPALLSGTSPATAAASRTAEGRLATRDPSSLTKRTSHRLEIPSLPIWPRLRPMVEPRLWSAVSPPSTLFFPFLDVRLLRIGLAQRLTGAGTLLISLLVPWQKVIKQDKGQSHGAVSGVH